MSKNPFRLCRRHAQVELPQGDVGGGAEMGVANNVREEHRLRVARTLYSTRSFLTLTRRVSEALQPISSLSLRVSISPRCNVSVWAAWSIVRQTVNADSIWILALWKTSFTDSCLPTLRLTRWNEEN